MTPSPRPHCRYDVIAVIIVASLSSSRRPLHCDIIFTPVITGPTTGEAGREDGRRAGPHRGQAALPALIRVFSVEDEDSHPTAHRRRPRRSTHTTGRREDAEAQGSLGGGGGGGGGSRLCRGSSCGTGGGGGGPGSPLSPATRRACWDRAAGHAPRQEPQAEGGRACVGGPPPPHFPSPCLGHCGPF